ncbi:piggyBac transposable element-derived protein 4-like [Diretmus argenteus]
MPKAPRKRGGPRPGAGQLTLEQALNRVIHERNLVETDTDEPPEDVCSSSSEHHDSEEWFPFRASPRTSKRTGKSQVYPPSWKSMADWSPRAMPFTAVPGPLKAAASIQSDEPAHFLELLLSDEVGELKRFLGLLFLTGLIRKPSLEEYWSINTALETPYFRATMPRNRFQLIWRFLHFSDNRDVDAADRLHKVRPVLDLLLANFREMFQPSQNISVDEGMMAWRGRLRFRVYNPAKPTKYGIKSYILCDSANGYCYAMKPYCGEHSSLYDTVRFLVDGLEGFGYRLWMDNFYNSEAMCRLLLSLKIHSAGTLRVNRGEPPSIRGVSNAKLAVGDRLACHNDVAMVLAWRDKRIVRMISTFHQDEMKTVAVREKGQSVRIPQLKPACIVEYNQFMNGVDRLDQKIAYYPFMRKTAKWSSKLSREQPPPPPAAMATPAHPRRRVSSTRLEVDFAGHVPVELQPTATQKKPFRKCVVCKKKGKRRETKHVCPRCDHVPLCLFPCYFEYHSQ